MKKTIRKSFIIHNPSYKSADSQVKIMRIILTPEHTKVDFGYQANSYYTRGGWVKIYPESFVRDKKNGEKYKFLKADRIPVNPGKHDFKSTIDYLYFSLYFEPLPPDTKYIDIIENEKEDKTYFNFYDVEVVTAKMVDEIL